VVEDFAAKLVAEDDRLVRAHEVGVAGLGHHVGDFVAVVAGVQVGAADAAAEDVDQQLSLRRHRGRLIDDFKLRVGAGDGLHLAERSGESTSGTSSRCICGSWPCVTRRSGIAPRVADSKRLRSAESLQSHESADNVLPASERQLADAALRSNELSLRGGQKDLSVLADRVGVSGRKDDE
jgi:hypothetical protein